MLNGETQEGNSYEKLPYLDERELGRDFIDLYREIDDRDEWDKFESKLLDDLIDNPGWLLEKEPELAQIALDALKASKGSGKPIRDRLIGQVDERITVPLFLRAIEIFSAQKGYKYLWSSASYENVENQENFLIATFDISLDSTKEHYFSKLSGKRKNPCVVRLSIESLVNKYRLSGRHEMELFFEHAPESFFDSIDLKSDLEGLDIKIFKGIKEESTEFENVETKYREVLTDEAEVVGPDDIVDGLEALPAGCGVVAISDQENKIVGMIHASMLIEKEEAESLVSKIISEIGLRGGEIKNLTISAFNMSINNKQVLENAFLILADMVVDLSGKDIDADNCLVRINKNTGATEEVDLLGNNLHDKYWLEDEKMQDKNIRDNYWDEEEERQLAEFYGQDQSEEEKEGEKKLINPAGNQDAMRINQIDDETLEIEWIKQDFKKTRFSSKGPESEMYKYIKKRFPDLSKAFLAGFSIMTDDEGKPQTIGDRGGGSSIVSRLEEKEN